MPAVTVQINTIAARGLPAVLADHRAMRAVEAVLKTQIGDCARIGTELIFTYRGAHARALDTILWFAYGERPDPVRVRWAATLR